MAQNEKAYTAEEARTKAEEFFNYHATWGPLVDEDIEAFRRTAATLRAYADLLEREERMPARRRQALREMEHWLDELCECGDPRWQHENANADCDEPCLACDHCEFGFEPRVLTLTPPTTEPDTIPAQTEE